MNYVIEDNVAIPLKPTLGRGKGTIIPGSCTDTMTKLEVGQSFAVNSAGLAYPARKRMAFISPEKKFEIRKMPNNETRIFRIA